MRSNFELNLSLLVVIILTTVYIAYEALATPAGSHPFGRALGILGAMLMLMTEVLYSARKRWGLIRFGQVRHWLSFHIFTGIVGPALVLMHTGLEFRGLAGLTMFLTVVVVASGFLGRYIYTAVPRTMAGKEVDRRTLESQTVRQREMLLSWSAGKSNHIQRLVQQETALTARGQKASPLAILTRGWREYSQHRRLQMSIRALEKEERARMSEIEALIKRQRQLKRQIDSLQTVRQMMTWWHTLHVPLGLTLFAAVFIHIIAAIYYSGL
jgi:hypothetical protein